MSTKMKGKLLMAGVSALMLGGLLLLLEEPYLPAAIGTLGVFLLIWAEPLEWKTITSNRSISLLFGLASLLIFQGIKQTICGGWLLLFATELLLVTTMVAAGAGLVLGRKPDWMVVISLTFLGVALRGADLSEHFYYLRFLPSGQDIFVFCLIGVLGSFLPH